MSDVNVNGTVVASNVVETIVSMALKDVEGIACVGPSTQNGIMNVLGGKPAQQSIEVSSDEDGKLCLGIHVEVFYGYALPALAENLRKAVADEVALQLGAEIGAIDVYVDALQFGN